MSERAPYSRVYWSVMDDPKFDGIRENPKHFGAWCLLLIVADMAHPAPAFPPPAVPKASMKMLVEAGLVDPLSGGRFRIHGLDAERGRRSDAGRVGGLVSGRSRTVERTGNERSQDPRTKSNLAEQSRAETSLAEQTREDALSTYWTLTGKYPNGAAKTWIEELANEFSDAKVSAAMGAEANGSPQGLLGRVRDHLRSEADRAEKARAKAEADRLAAEAVKRKISPEQAEANRHEVNRLVTAMMPGGKVPTTVFSRPERESEA